MNDGLKLIELQLATITHCKALKEVTSLMVAEKYDAAIARLDGAVMVLEATIRGQCAGVTMKCPACQSEQDVVAWVDDKQCRNCGGDLAETDSHSEGGEGP